MSPEESEHLLPGTNAMWSNYEDAPQCDLPPSRHKGVACAPLITPTNETKSRVRTRVCTREAKTIPNFYERNRQRA